MIDRGTHIELVIGPAVLCGPGFIDIVADALARFAAKALLVVCDGPAEIVGFNQAYDNRVKPSSIVRARIAIVLGGREPTDADRLTHCAIRQSHHPYAPGPRVLHTRRWMSWRGSATCI